MPVNDRPGSPLGYGFMLLLAFLLFTSVMSTCNAQPQEESPQPDGAPEMPSDRTFSRYMADQDRSVYLRFEHMEEVGPTMMMWAFFHETGSCREIPTGEVRWDESKNAVFVGPNRWNLNYDLKNQTLTLETEGDTMQYKRAKMGERVRRNCRIYEQT